MVKKRIEKAARKEKSLARLPENWAALSATEKTRHLVERPDLPQLVGSLAPDKLYLLISDLGVDSSLELFSLVESEQWTGIVDLACWADDVCAPERFAGWLNACQNAHDWRITSGI